VEAELAKGVAGLHDYLLLWWQWPWG